MELPEGRMSAREKAGNWGFDTHLAGLAACDIHQNMPKIKHRQECEEKASGGGQNPAHVLQNAAKES